jgi:hypothetical protein
MAVVAGFAPISYNVYQDVKSGSPSNALRTISAGITGFNMVDSKWEPHNMVTGLFPIALGFGVHKYIGGKLGLNRMLSKAGVPLIRI